MIGDNQRSRTAKNLIKVREARQECFPSELFDEHAWNILLQLFAATFDNEVVVEKELIHRAKVSVAIGRRWINHLIADGQIKQRQDGDDVRFTEPGLHNMRKFLDEAGHIHETTRSPVE